MRCATSSDSAFRRATSTIAGSCSSDSASSRISSENVAENSRFWRFFGSDREHAADVADETHVEHPVGFVEHEDLDVPEVDRLLLHVIEQPSGCRDEDVHATPERIDLRVDADAAIHERRLERHVPAVDAHALLDLCRELAGRGEDQRADLVLCRLTGDRAREPLQHRQHEAGGLAGAGLCAGEHVAAGENDGIACAWTGVGWV